MENQTGEKPPLKKRTGCLRRTCGCLAVAAVLSLCAVVAGWCFFSRWTPGGSAWERLPPDAIFAVEAHDAGTLLRAAAGDAGAMSFARPLFRRHQAFFDAAGIHRQQDLTEALHAMGGSLGWLYRMFFPNYLLFAARSFGDDGAFLIVQPPRWFAWAAGAASDEGEVAEVTFDEGVLRRAFFAFREDMLIIGTNSEIIAHVLQNWERRAAPFGKKAGRGDAYCMIAMKPENSAGANAGSAAADSAPASPFLSGGLANNFIAPGAEMLPGTAANDARNIALRFRAIVFPGEEGWNIRFESTDAEKPFAPAPFAERTNKPAITELTDAENTAPPAVLLPDSSDAEIALRVPRAALKRLDEWIEKTIPEQMGGAWLRYGWLERAGGTFALLASRPAAPVNLPYPPMPVLSLGWNLASLLAPAPFANMLARWLDGLPAPARALVKMEAAEDKLSGRISLPDVMLNGARPAWKFFTGMTPAFGWMSTDPSGIPDEPLLPRLAALRLPPSADDRRAVAEMNWDMSRVFINAAADIAADRLSQIPEARSLLPLVRSARRLFSAYPRGTVQGTIDADTLEAAGGAFVPFGMDVAFD